MAPGGHPQKGLEIVAAIAAGLVGAGTPAFAQIIPDGTLGTRVNGTIAPCSGSCVITDGTIRGSHVFHSFRQFSLPNADFAGFVTNPAIQSVIVRVTGVGQPFVSTLNGTIATATPSHFFLINPNGIVFGPNAVVITGGSFLATTADRLLFQDGTVLDVRDPAPLLTVTVPAGLQFGPTPGHIQAGGLRLGVGINSLFTDFALVGGNLALDNAVVLTPGSRIELVGVGGAGRVGLGSGGLTVPPTLARGDITIANQSRLDVAGADGGSLAIYARNLDISGGTRVVAGIRQGLGTVGSQAGELSLDVTDTLSLRQASVVGNVVQPGATGNGGNLRIGTGSLSVTEASQFLAVSLGNGNAGSVTLNARDRVYIHGLGSGLFSSVGSVDQVSVPQGRGGQIQISTNTLEMVNGAQLRANTLGRGDAGSVVIQARDRVFLSGANTSIANTVGDVNQQTTPQGKGGNVEISAHTLEMEKGAQLQAFTLGMGDAGDVILHVRDRVHLEDPGTAISSSVGAINQPTVPHGQGGNVQITANTLEVLNGAQLIATTLGIGDAGKVILKVHDRTHFRGHNTIITSSVGAINQSSIPRGQGGNVEITTNLLEILDGAQVIASTLGIGDAGNVIIQGHDRVFLSGANTALISSAGAITQLTVPQGQGGNVNITTNTLEILNGAQLLTATFGIGDAGNVILNARDRVLLSGIDTAITSSVGDEAQQTVPQGQGGHVQISTHALDLLRGAAIVTDTWGLGAAGAVTITARDHLTIEGLNAMHADKPIFTGIFVNSLSFSPAGNITIATPTLQLSRRAAISAQTVAVDGGNITLNVSDLLLMRYGSEISTTAGFANLAGNGGNITLNAPRGFLVSAPLENNDITANAFSGSGGNITLNAQGVYGFTPRSRADLERLLITPPFDPQRLPSNDITASSQLGVNGTIAINTPDVDPSRGLVALPTGFVDRASQMDQSCAPQAQSASRFTITGRGGLPAVPTDALQPSTILAEWPTPTPQPSQVGRAPTPAVLVADERAIVEAQGMVRGRTGEVWLVAAGPPSTPEVPWLRQPGCPSGKAF